MGMGIDQTGDQGVSVELQFGLCPIPRVCLGGREDGDDAAFMDREAMLIKDALVRFHGNDPMRVQQCIDGLHGRMITEADEPCNGVAGNASAALRRPMQTGQHGWAVLLDRLGSGEGRFHAAVLGAAFGRGIGRDRLALTHARGGDDVGIDTLFDQVVLD